MPTTRLVPAPAVFAGLLALLLFSLLGAQVPELPPRPRAPNDQSEYRHLVLENGVRVLLVSDPKLNKSSAALAVDVGSLNDPENRQGLAHFLEHMLFLGTEKYPDEAEYGNFLRSNSGYSNAYTARDHTNFLFEIRHEAFEGALDRFSQFFIAPLFAPEFTEREMNAVNSENQKNLENDNWRQFQLSKIAYRPGHPARGFGTGSRETLGGTTREELLAFYNQYYSANRMCLTLVGKAGLDQLEAWARQYFAAVPNKNLPAPEYPPDFLQTKAALRVALVEPVADIRELTIQFALPGLRDDWATKSADLIEFILGYEGAGSLLSQVKAEGLATKISSGVYDACSSYTIFGVSFDLTLAGLEHRDRVLALVFAQLAEMRRAGYPSHLFRERAAMARIDEMFQDKGEGADRASGLTRIMHETPLEAAARAPYLWLREDPAGYQRLLDCMRPDNMFVTVAAKGVPTDQTEHYYGTKYSYTEDAGPAYAALLTPPKVVGLRLPAPNPFIPEDTTQLAVRPVRLIDEPALSLYYAQDTEFARPMVAEVFRVRLPRTMGSVKNAVLLSYYGACVNEALNEIAYTAGVAGLDVSVTADLEGVVIRLSGYDVSAPRLLDAVAKQLVEFTLDEERFAAVKDGLVRGLANFPRADAWRILLEKRRSLVREFYYRPEEQLPLAAKVTLAEVRTFARNLYRQGRIESLVYGNVSADEAIAAARQLAGVMKTKAVPAEKLLSRRMLEQRAGDALLTSEQLVVNNSAYRIEYTLGDDAPEIRAATRVLASFIEEPFYSELRTHQQLGYIVHGSAGDELRSHFAYFIIQSGDYTADVVAARAAKRISELPGLLAELPAEGWQMIVDGVRAELEEKDKTIAERAGRLFDLAYDYAGEWDRREATIAALEKLTQARAHEILAAAITPGTGRSRAFMGFSRDHKPEGEVKATVGEPTAWKQRQTYK